MTMFCIKSCFAGLILCFSLLGNSQNNLAILGETAFAVNTELSNTYRMNFGLRSRYALYQNKNIRFTNRQLDLVHFSTLKLDSRHTVSLGIQYRFRDLFDEGDDEFRLTEQFNIVKQVRATRYGHRFRTEQRFFQFFTTFRFWYRFTFDMPLKGSSLDISESYWVQSFEGVASFTKALRPTYDFRTTSQLGWLLSEYLKLQVGLEYRIESFNITTLHRIFLLTTAVCKV